MKILHIASIKNSSLSGVCVAVPAHIISQQKDHEVALLNMIDDKIDGINHQFNYKGGNWLNSVGIDYMNPDIVVFHEVFYIQFPFIARQLKKRSIPYIIIPHGCLVKSAFQHKWLKKKIACLLLFNRFINSAAAIQCLSENEIHSTCFAPKKILGTNGVNTPSSVKTNFRKESIVLTYIGRLDIKIKGLDLLLSAIYSLNEELRRGGIVINIYGPDVLGSYKILKDMIRSYQIESIVELHSSVTGKEKEQVLLNSDLFIQVSRHEGMPMGILEALSYGLPCIITKGTSLDNVITRYDAGWVADNNAKSIAACIQQAISMPQVYMEKSKNAQQMIYENFTWSSVMTATLQIYKDIVCKNNLNK